VEFPEGNTPKMKNFNFSSRISLNELRISLNISEYHGFSKDFKIIFHRYSIYSDTHFSFPSIFYDIWSYLLIFPSHVGSILPVDKKSKQ